MRRHEPLNRAPKRLRVLAIALGLLLGASGVMGSTWKRPPSHERVVKITKADALGAITGLGAEARATPHRWRSDASWINRRGERGLNSNWNSARCESVLDGLGCASVLPKVAHTGDAVGLQVIGVSRCKICKTLGLQPGDIVTALAARPARSLEDWSEALLAAAFEPVVRLDIEREGQRATLSAKRTTSTVAIVDLEAQSGRDPVLVVRRVADVAAEERLGLEQGDRITAIDGLAIRDFASFDPLSDATARNTSSHDPCRLELTLDGGETLALDWGPNNCSLLPDSYGAHSVPSGAEY